MIPVVFAAFFAAASPCTPTLGADLTDVSHAARRTRGIPDFVAGALVRVVWAGGPAGRAGVLAGDVIQGVGSDLVQNACDVRLAVAKHGCGDVRLAIRRGRDTIALDATLVDAARFRRKKKDDATACQNGDGAACTALAKAHGDDIVLLRQACDLGDGEGCFMLGLKLGNGREGAGAYEQACDDGNPLACTNLGWMYQYGHGVAVDLDAAMRLYKRGCDGTRCSGRNNLGCVNVARLYRDGIGVKADPELAIVLFRKVCDRGPNRGDAEDAENVARSCSAAGTTALFGEGVVVRDIPRSVGFLEKGCDGGDPFGCFNLGVLYEFGKEIPQDKSRAAGYYQRACDRGDTEACQRGAALRK
jgi:TPR repeat protein